MFASVQTRVYGRTSRRIVRSPCVPIATRFTTPVHSGASASAQSTNVPTVLLLIVVSGVSPFAAARTLIVTAIVATLCVVLGTVILGDKDRGLPGRMGLTLAELFRCQPLQSLQTVAKTAFLQHS